MRGLSRPGSVGSLLYLALLLIAPAAGAFPIVYTGGGTLSAPGGGGDPIKLTGSTVRITLYADTADLPDSVTSGATSAEARYTPSSGFLSITNRAGGASDLLIPYTPDLVTVNAFDESGSVDTFAVDEGRTPGVPGSSEFYVGGLRVSFINAAFFPGTGPGALPDFDITGGAVVFGYFYDLDHVALYQLNSPFLQAEGPEPGVGLLLAAGIAALVARRSAR